MECNKENKEKEVKEDIWNTKKDYCVFYHINCENAANESSTDNLIHINDQPLTELLEFVKFFETTQSHRLKNIYYYLDFDFNEIDYIHDNDELKVISFALKKLCVRSENKMIDRIKSNLLFRWISHNCYNRSCLESFNQDTIQFLLLAIQKYCNNTFNNSFILFNYRLTEELLQEILKKNEVDIARTNTLDIITPTQLVIPKNHWFCSKVSIIVPNKIESIYDINCRSKINKFGKILKIRNNFSNVNFSRKKYLQTFTIERDGQFIYSKDKENEFILSYNYWYNSELDVYVPNNIHCILDNDQTNLIYKDGSKLFNNISINLKIKLNRLKLNNQEYQKKFTFKNEFDKNIYQYKNYHGYWNFCGVYIPETIQYIIHNDNINLINQNGEKVTNFSNNQLFSSHLYKQIYGIRDKFNYYIFNIENIVIFNRLRVSNLELGITSDDIIDLFQTVDGDCTYIGSENCSDNIFVEASSYKKCREIICEFNGRKVDDKEMVVEILQFRNHYFTGENIDFLKNQDIITVDNLTLYQDLKILSGTKVYDKNTEYFCLIDNPNDLENIKNELLKRTLQNRCLRNLIIVRNKTNDISYKLIYKRNKN